MNGWFNQQLHELKESINKLNLTSTTLSRRMLYLTLVLVILTAVLVALTIILVCKTPKLQRDQNIKTSQSFQQEIVLKS